MSRKKNEILRQAQGELWSAWIGEADSSPGFRPTRNDKGLGLDVLMARLKPRLFNASFFQAIKTSNREKILSRAWRVVFWIKWLIRWAK